MWKQMSARGVSILVALEGALIVALAVSVVILALENTALSSTIRAHQYAACLQANKDRAKDKAVWDFILSASPHDPHDAAKLARFRQLIAQKDTPLPCKARYG